MVVHTPQNNFDPLGKVSAISLAVATMQLWENSGKLYSKLATSTAEVR